MIHISIRNLTVEYKLYGKSSRSLKKRILSQATGGRIISGADDVVTVRALDNLSLEVREGDRIGLIGHNGAGKSTLLRILSGIYKPTAGEIEIEGRVGTLLDPYSGMDGEATGYENIYLRGFVLGMSKREINAKVDEIIEFSELGQFIDLPVKAYSWGMFSRLAFAISTSVKPDILLIDEGIGAGDEGFQKKAQERLLALVGAVPILLLASHNFYLIHELCNKTFTLSSGRGVSLENLN